MNIVGQNKRHITLKVLTIMYLKMFYFRNHENRKIPEKY